MKNKIFSIRFILSFSIVIVAVASIVFIVFFAYEYTSLQRTLTISEFERVTAINATEIDKEISLAEQNLTRLKGYISILGTIPEGEATKYLVEQMSENIQFEKNEYNCYFAFEPERSRRLFNKDGYVLTVHKNFAQLHTDQFGLPKNSVYEIWTNNSYQKDPKEVWYHIAKNSRDFEVTPIYFDESYMKVWMFTIAKGIYENNKFVGMVGLDILLDGMLDQIEAVKIGNTGGLFIAERDSGLVLSKVRNDNDGKMFLDIQKRLTTKLFENGGGTFWRDVLNNDTEARTIKEASGTYVISTKKLEKLPWTIVAYQSKSELNSALNKSLILFSLIVFFVIVSLVAFSRLVARSITVPIGRLVEVMKKVKDANIVGLSAPVSGTSETRILGEIFNKTLDTIGEAVKEKDRYYKELEELNKTLEQRIEERTKEIKTTLDKLKDTQEQLVVKEKLASLGALTAGIAHEIKNPLNFINNFSLLTSELINELKELLQKETSNVSAKDLEAINDILRDVDLNARKIHEHGARADDIVKNMLLHSRGKSGERMPVDLNGLVQEYVNLSYHGMRAVDPNFNIAIRTDLDANLQKISVVPQNIGRVILNLANNGFYSANEKKKISDAKFAPEIVITTKDLGDKVELRIKDNGLGIPEKILDKIFNPFFTTKPAGSGTGLGLSIAFDIIAHEHGGEIKVVSEADKYCEFIILLPKR